MKKLLTMMTALLFIVATPNVNADVNQPARVKVENYLQSTVKQDGTVVVTFMDGEEKSKVVEFDATGKAIRTVSLPYRLIELVNLNGTVFFAAKEEANSRYLLFNETGEKVPYTLRYEGVNPSITATKDGLFEVSSPTKRIWYDEQGNVVPRQTGLGCQATSEGKKVTVVCDGLVKWTKQLTAPTTARVPDVEFVDVTEVERAKGLVVRVTMASADGQIGETQSFTFNQSGELVYQPERNAHVAVGDDYVTAVTDKQLSTYDFTTKKAAKIAIPTKWRKLQSKSSVILPEVQDDMIVLRQYVKKRAETFEFQPHAYMLFQLVKGAPKVVAEGNDCYEWYSHQGIVYMATKTGFRTVAQLGKQNVFVKLKLPEITERWEEASGGFNFATENGTWYKLAPSGKIAATRQLNIAAGDFVAPVEDIVVYTAKTKSLSFTSRQTGKSVATVKVPTSETEEGYFSFYHIHELSRTIIVVRGNELYIWTY